MSSAASSSRPFAVVTHALDPTRPLPRAADTVLTDPEKRQIYDRGGEEALKQGGGGGGGMPPDFDPREIFKQFFGGEGGGPEHMFSSFGTDGAQGGFGGGGGGDGGDGGGGMGPPAASQMHRVKLVKADAGGLGLKVDKENAVIAVTAGGAAEKAGVRVGDVVWEVDGSVLSPGERLAQVPDYLST